MSVACCSGTAGGGGGGGGCGGSGCGGLFLSGVPGAAILVFGVVLRVEPARRRDVPRESAVAERGRLLRAFGRRALLSRTALEHQPQQRRRRRTQTHP